MKAVSFARHGGPEVLELVELDPPAVRARDVRIRVKAVALNHLDVWVREGWPGLKLSLPHVLGSDVAGVVEAVGPEVDDLSPGAEVIVNPGLSCGCCERCLSGRDPLCPRYSILGEHRAGGYAELLSVPRQNVAAKPAQLTFEEAACLPLTFLTSWTMLVRRAQLLPGETVLVHAAGSGVGSAAVQIAALSGAHVIATASTDEKLARAEALGAHATINYERDDFLAEVKRLTERRMVDVVFEHVGATTFVKSLACLKPGGRLVTCGATTGPKVELDLRVLFYKNLSVLGSTMGSKGDLLALLGLFERGRLRPVLDRVLPLSAAADGHRLLSERAAFGNIVLRP